MRQYKQVIVKALDSPAIGFVYFTGFEHKGPNAEWSHCIHEAEKFDSVSDAYSLLIKEDELDWRVFEEGIYKIQEILVKKD